MSTGLLKRRISQFIALLLFFITRLLNLGAFHICSESRGPSRKIPLNQCCCPETETVSRLLCKTPVSFSWGCILRPATWWLPNSASFSRMVKKWKKSNVLSQVLCVSHSYERPFIGIKALADRPWQPLLFQLHRREDWPVVKLLNMKPPIPFPRGNLCTVVLYNSSSREAVAPPLKYTKITLLTIICIIRNSTFAM